MEGKCEGKPDVHGDVPGDVQGDVAALFSGLRAEVATLRDEIAGIRRRVRLLERIGPPADLARRLELFIAGRDRLDEPALWTGLQIPQAASTLRTAVRRELHARHWFPSRSGKLTYWQKLNPAD